MTTSSRTLVEYQLLSLHPPPRIAIGERVRKAAAAKPAASVLLALTAFYSSEPFAIHLFSIGRKALPQRLSSAVRNDNELQSLISTLSKLELAFNERESIRVSESVRLEVRALMSREVVSE